MRLLTIGSGNRGAIIADMFARHGMRVNGIPLFKCYAISNEVELLKSLKGVPRRKRFHILEENLSSNKDVRSIINTILAEYNIFESLLLTTSLKEEFGFLLSVELAEKLKELCEEPILALGVLSSSTEPTKHSSLEIRKRIKELKNAVDVLILFEEKQNTDAIILNSLNILSMVGEIDLRKKQTGEVVVDTSDVLNSLRKDGVAAVGISRRRLPMSWLRRIVYRKECEIKGLRTKRMMEMFKEALENNLSAGIDLETAKSALLVFSGHPEEITMDGIFSCITMLEKINPDIEVRYGDYPVRSNQLSAVLLFSGITRLKL
jgi:cell division GTPase FtsZ